MGTIPSEYCDQHFYEEYEETDENLTPTPGEDMEIIEDPENNGDGDGGGDGDYDSDGGDGDGGGDNYYYDEDGDIIYYN